MPGLSRDRIEAMRRRSALRQKSLLGQYVESASGDTADTYTDEPTSAITSGSTDTSDDTTPSTRRLRTRGAATADAAPVSVAATHAVERRGSRTSRRHTTDRDQSSNNPRSTTDKRKSSTSQESSYDKGKCVVSRPYSIFCVCFRPSDCYFRTGTRP